MSRPAQRKILQVFQPAVGGVPTYVSSLATGLLRRGWDVTVAAPPESIGLDEIRAGGGDVVPLAIGRSPQPGADRAAVQRLVGLIRHRGIDLVHAHSSKAGGLVALAGRTAGVQSVYTPHAWAFQMRNPLLVRAALAWGEATLVRLHGAVVTVCEDEADAARRWHVASEDQVHVVHTGLDPRPPQSPNRAAARQRLGLPVDDVIAGWVGRTGRQKQPEELVSLGPHVSRSATIAALGHGLQGDATLEPALTGAGVIVLGERTDAEDLLVSADLLLMTSAWEGFPLAVLEAMRVGLPVVAYDVGGLREQIESGVSGLLVEPGDRAALAAAVRELADDHPRRQHMGSAARSRFLERFTFDQMLDGVEEVYAFTLDITRSRLIA